jgi:hypothetical protein
MATRDPLDQCRGFNWDAGNAEKNWERHGVTPEETEDLFFNEPLVVRSDVRHSKNEKRYYALGRTGAGRKLFASFTVRRQLIRAISVRDMNRNEAEVYGRYEKETNS